jgi:thioesterase domain-containing protein/acyl carrier protein
VTLVRENTDVRLTIERIWSEVAPFASHMDETVAWRETGADSLLTLQFLVRLEQALEQPLSFDMFTLDMTVGEIIQAIEKSQQAPRGPQAAPADKLTVFLIPGILGDEPTLAEFRRSLANRLHFETLQVVDLDQPSQILRSMSATAADLVRQITEKQPDGPLYLAGYSMGGMLAFQAANDLIAAGRDVRFVGIIDAMYGRPKEGAGTAPVEALEGEARTSMASRFKRRDKETFVTYLDRVVYGLLLRLKQLEWARRWAVSGAKRNDFATNASRRQYLLPRFRGEALHDWRPTVCTVPTLLTVSDEFERRATMDTWTALCPNLTVLRVPGAHNQVFSPASLAKLNPALLASLELARAG